MRRVDRLLIKVQEAYRLDALQLSIAFLEKDPVSGKWNAIADLWDGKPQGETKRLTMVCDTEEEALAAWLSALNDWRMTRGKPPQILADLARHQAEQARTGKTLSKKRRKRHEQPQE